MALSVEKVTRRSFYFWGAALLLLGGCGWNNFISSFNPDYQGKQYHRLLVMVPLVNGEAQKVFETEVSYYLKSNSVAAVPSYSLLGVSQNPTENEVLEEAQAQGFDAILLIRFQPWSELTEPFLRKSRVGNLIFGTAGQPANLDFNVRSSPGGRHYLTRGFLAEAGLVDVSQAEAAWITDGHLSPGNEGDFQDRVDDYAIHLANQMDQDDVLTH